ncbi:hypothetical protein [Micromonospora sp. IBHARD004]|uniref:hypothetical protein n=1 Tax=Micromonospora sp. IBHARD004 TaxID=3457764 RepID=UPI00405A36F9
MRGGTRPADDHDPVGAFVCVNGLRTGPDGRLWVVDAGAPGIGLPAVAGGARLIAIDLAIDAAGTIYLSDVEQRRILTITPDRQVDTLVADPRLIWGDAMWIDGSGHLWIPAAQLNRTPGLAGGARSVDYPVWIYKLKIDATPPTHDHP